MSNIQLDMERAGFEIHDVEGLRPHYALTLRHWVARLEAARGAAVREVGEAVWRVWHLYMVACALEFEAGSIGVLPNPDVQPSAGLPGRCPIRAPICTTAAGPTSWQPATGRAP